MGLEPNQSVLMYMETSHLSSPLIYIFFLISVSANVQVNLPEGNLSMGWVEVDLS